MRRAALPVLEPVSATCANLFGINFSLGDKARDIGNGMR
jgi:hypothetical protein